MLYRVQTLTSRNAEESENSPESPDLGEIKRMHKQCVPGTSPFSHTPGDEAIITYSWILIKWELKMDSRKVSKSPNE